MPAKSSVFSGIILVLGTLAVCGTIFWFLYTSFSPVDVPAPPPARTALTFDPQTDVSQNKIFGQLQDLRKNADLSVQNIGRPNPFMKVPITLPQAISASSTSSTAPMTETASTTFDQQAPTTTQP
jgi:hypothetical protein